MARLKSVKDEKERRSKQIFDSMVMANQKIIGEQSLYVQKKHAEKTSPNGKTRYDGVEGSPIQRFSPQQLKHMIDIRDQRMDASATKNELAYALKIQIAQDKHRHEFREIDLKASEMATSGEIMK